MWVRSARCGNARLTLGARFLTSACRLAAATPTPATIIACCVSHPPEILITTPESLNLLLSSAGGKRILGTIETVILDEIHGVVSNKRGVYRSAGA